MITFYDECVDAEVTVDIRDIIEMLSQDGFIFIFNVDGIFFKTKQIIFN